MFELLGIEEWDLLEVCRCEKLQRFVNVDGGKSLPPSNISHTNPLNLSEIKTAMKTHSSILLKTLKLGHFAMFDILV